MKSKIFFFFLMYGFFPGTFCQKSIELTFTAVNNVLYVKLDSIKVINRSHGNYTVLHWPDTTYSCEIAPGDTLLHIGYAMGYPLGVQSISNRVTPFHLFQSYPNPVRDLAVMSMSLPLQGSVNIKIADIRGKVALNFNRELKEGTHSFVIHPGDERVYILTARWNGITQRIKILTDGPISGKICKLEYKGIENGNPALKQSLATTDLVVKESGILDTPDTNKTYTFQFATNIPCPGTPTVEYEGLVYNTIQIFSQCWLKENLNVGTMLNSSQNQTNNGIKEKYCYNNQSDSCSKYGGLYKWDEMMQYTTQRGTQGICPPGWHLPTDEEWKVLEGAVDSKYGIGANIWDSYGWYGYDVGPNLMVKDSWYWDGNGKDLSGFSLLPGGVFEEMSNSFSFVQSYGFWWSSTEVKNNEIAFYRSLHYDAPEVSRDNYDKVNGKSVRCLRNYQAILHLDYLYNNK